MSHSVGPKAFLLATAFYVEGIPESTKAGAVAAAQLPGPDDVSPEMKHLMSEQYRSTIDDWMKYREGLQSLVEIRDEDTFLRKLGEKRTRIYIYPPTLVYQGKGRARVHCRIHMNMKISSMLSIIHQYYNIL